MLASLNRIYRQVIGKPLVVEKVMGDADAAQLNGVTQGFGGSAQLKYLMCFYHVAAKVVERTRVRQPPHAKLVMSGLYDMHFARCEGEFRTTKAQVLAEWADVPVLATFTTYFKSQWLTGRFTSWQVYHKTRGWATTNNPVEQFSRTIKRQYTLHSRLKMGALLQQFLTCCTSESLSDKTFATGPTIPKSLIRRTKELSAAKLLHEYSPRATVAFLLDDFQPLCSTCRRPRCVKDVSADFPPGSWANPRNPVGHCATGNAPCSCGSPGDA
ncbi:hypothetical protein PC129_g20669 [Phytophthora cactorum]|uniref:MULE transposase domain-containing protein n=1 Tax=Phytophthora cactorum TaxID=29920 RepID=A0A8T1JYN0_9STRA|nr:hypothetical protein Pcac1_g2111 [Phytophthora cactorum]KAG2878879.1 hypothetical protein PC114_g22856 [Phytophthora cactorum]KAG2885463.1 hypothetical protein PC115_g21008 [Phytophthora cactorum]KAG2894763.1 hypothetical protein PC117_g23406 [Phytophthora cactorum]KAG3015372.1 hypothetical protein PC119_g11785 [Phytophthora cactorum]